jgi:hypothetical protein
MPLKPSPLHRFLLASGLLAGSLAQAQTPPAKVPAPSPSSLGWQACQAIKADAGAQLTCFQQWADSQSPANTLAASMATAPANPDTGTPATQIMLLPSLNTDAPDGKPIGCRNDQYSEISRFWELQRGTDCGTFALRGYRPISLAFVMSGGIDPPPVIGSGSPPDYRHAETKIQLSVRTKVAKGLLKAAILTRTIRIHFGSATASKATGSCSAAACHGHFAPPTTNRSWSIFTRTRSHCRAAGITGFRAWGWCTNPTASRIRCRAAGTGPI